MAAARDGRDTEKLLEGWLHRLSPKEVKRRGLTPTSDAWSPKYYVLCRVQESVHLDFFKKPPKKDEQSKDSLHLASYQVNKKTDVNKHKHFICELLVNELPSYYAFDTEERRDSFVFFLQTQKRLQDDITGTTFSVKPEDNADQRKIGARGSVCYLHVCSAGLTLALQVSRSIVAQWPLKCIRWYSSSDKGQFVFEAGRRAPMGEGRYSFDTHLTQDTQLYDLLDKYVMDANSLWQAHSSDEFIEKKIFEDYCSLRLLALGFADMVFSRHLMRLSTCNFDDLTVPLAVLPLTDRPASVSQSLETAAKSRQAAATNGDPTGVGELQLGVPSAATAAQRSEIVSQNANNWAKVAVLEAHSQHEESPGALGKTKENYMDMALGGRIGSHRCASLTSSPGILTGGSPFADKSWHTFSSSPIKGGDLEFSGATSLASASLPPKRYVQTPAEASMSPPDVRPDAYENTAEARSFSLKKPVVPSSTNNATAHASAAVRSMAALDLDADAVAARSSLHKGSADARHGARSDASDYLYEPADLADEEEAGNSTSALALLPRSKTECGGSKDAYEQVADAELSEHGKESDESVLASLGRPPPVPTAPRPLPPAAVAAAVGRPITDCGIGVPRAQQAASVSLKKHDRSTVDGFAGIRASPASVVFSKVKKVASPAADVPPSEASHAAAGSQGRNVV